MKMIDVFNLMAKGEIEKGTKLKIGREVYNYIETCVKDNGYSFVHQEGPYLEDDELITQPFLNSEVELIPPKEKKYLIKVNIPGLQESFAYLNYGWFGSCVTLNSLVGTKSTITHFTKSEMQAIKPVREFLEDMKGKYELIEVGDNEIY